MMDIVERLRKDARGPALEAADEIERLREALQKIAQCQSYKVTSTIIHLKMIAESALKEKE